MGKTPMVSGVDFPTNSVTPNGIPHLLTEAGAQRISHLYNDHQRRPVNGRDFYGG